jgi:hypothetical protein
MNKILIIHLFSCWFMTGVIWLVQILIYPLFKLIGEKDFFKIHQFHMKQITWVVAPAMTLEITTSVWLFLNFKNSTFLLNFVLTVILWGFTALINVPTHNKLKFNSDISKRNLVLMNWPRTFIWTFRSLLLTWTILYKL